METEKTQKMLRDMNGKEAIETIGRELYGENFSIDDPGTFRMYKMVHNQFKKSIWQPDGTKGILVNGSIGVGKTAMMRIFSRLNLETDRAFGIVSAMHLKDLSEDWKAIEIKERFGIGCKTDLLIDDIGLSGDVKHYGNTINIISELIYERNHLYVRYGIKTHFTSNVPTELDDRPEFAKEKTLKTLYGSRCLDRIYEMCEIFAWRGETKR